MPKELSEESMSLFSFWKLLNELYALYNDMLNDNRAPMTAMVVFL